MRKITGTLDNSGYLIVEIEGEWKGTLLPTAVSAIAGIVAMREKEHIKSSAKAILKAIHRIALKVATDIQDGEPIHSDVRFVGIQIAEQEEVE